MLLGNLGSLAGVASAFPGLGKSLWGVACAECYITSSTLGGTAAHALDKAVLVLGLPPLAMFLSIFFYFRRRSRAWNGRSSSPMMDGMESSRTYAGF
jgi:hypothetical protein